MASEDAVYVGDRQSSERCTRKLISRHCLDKTRTRWNDFLFLITDDRDFRPQTCTNGLVFRECKHIKNIFEDVYFTKNSFHITLINKINVNFHSFLISLIVSETSPPVNPDLIIEDVDLNIFTNSRNHHTNEYDISEKSRDLVVRRGQTFDITIDFNKEYDPKKDDLKLVFLAGNCDRYCNIYTL